MDDIAVLLIYRFKLKKTKAKIFQRKIKQL